MATGHQADGGLQTENGGNRIVGAVGMESNVTDTAHMRSPNYPGWGYAFASVDLSVLSRNAMDWRAFVFTIQRDAGKNERNCERK